MRGFFAVAIVCTTMAFAVPAKADFDRHAPQTGASEQSSKQSWIVTRVTRIDRGTSQDVGGRPAGCPSGLFCGCALSLKLFGKIIPRLNLALNWKGFPPVPPAPGMVAARSGHVFELVQHVSGEVWTVWDANSGGGRIRVHQRSIAGYTIHNPHGGARYAGLR